MGMSWGQQSQSRMTVPGGDSRRGRNGSAAAPQPEISIPIIKQKMAMDWVVFIFVDLPFLYTYGLFIYEFRVCIR